MDSLHDPDIVLVSACQEVSSGCDDSFRALHDRHRDAVHRICLRITGDAHEALDAAQDTFLLAFRKIRSFRYRSRFSRWLCSIAARASFERLRMRGGLPRVELDELLLECPREVDPIGFAEQRERVRILRRALRRLPPHQREILLLRYVEGLSYDELACRLTIPDGSVRSRLHRAHAAVGRRVRAILEEQTLRSW